MVRILKCLSIKAVKIEDDLFAQVPIKSYDNDADSKNAKANTIRPSVKKNILFLNIGSDFILLLRIFL